jgi:two-component system, NtrC family, response regulator
MAKVLIIDDDQGMCVILSAAVEQAGHEVTCAHTIKDGLQVAAFGFFEVVFLDVMLPDGIGLDILPKLRGTPSKPEVIIITSRGNTDGAELAIKNGAWDYVEKPSSLKAMILPLLRALQYREEKKEKKQTVALRREGIIGSNPRIIDCLDLVAQAAGSHLSVLISGETGTGKELFAKAIHTNSPRSQNNFVVVDCGALPQSLIESMLFGHEKGAFTGADRATVGLITQADGGTLFLDEVGELPLSIQKAFLRVLQEHRFRPVGGKQEIESNFRMVAATNRDLDEMVRKDRFRQDLFYRLNAITITIPPLRQRLDDINELVMHFLTKRCGIMGVETKGLSPEFLQMLRDYEWPGNVRELINSLEEAIIKAPQEPILFPLHLPSQIRIRSASALLGWSKKSPTGVTPVDMAPPDQSLSTFQEIRESTLAEMEQKYFQRLMELTKGNIKEACRISGLSRNRLYIYLKRHNITRFGWR